MWLLKTATLELKYFVHERVVSYAILSHTWGDEEVTFQDMRGVRPQGQKGYRKIQKACQQAFRDGYEYIWIDTCCINEESSAELSEAINSMFSYYSTAEICYAYLQDVFCDDGHNAFDGAACVHPVRGEIGPDTRWFTRGWTLQELIAPSNLIFSDLAWNRIGSKEEQRENVAYITKIDKHLLTAGSPSAELNCYSVAARMSWAAHRHTTRPEDRAYSLLGLFGINMPLLYGEGINAFQRLQEEIISRTNDQSILAWHCGEPSSSSYAVFADSPEEFEGMSQVVPWPHSPRSSSRLTNSALEIEMPVIQLQETSGERMEYVLLNCHYQGNLTGPLALGVLPSRHNEGAERLDYVILTHRYCVDDGRVPRYPVYRRRRLIDHEIASRATTRLIHLHPRFSQHMHLSMVGASMKASWDTATSVWVHVVDTPSHSVRVAGSHPPQSWSDEGLFRTQNHYASAWRVWDVGSVGHQHDAHGSFGLAFYVHDGSYLRYGLFEGEQLARLRELECLKYDSHLHDPSLGEISIDLGGRVRVTARANVNTAIMGYIVHEIIVSFSDLHESANESMEVDKVRELDQEPPDTAWPPVCTWGARLLSPSEMCC